MIVTFAWFLVFASSSFSFVFPVLALVGVLIFASYAFQFCLSHENENGQVLCGSPRWARKPQSFVIGNMQLSSLDRHDEKKGSHRVA